MPELPDITVYIEALETRILGHALERVQLASPFLLRTATPPITAVEGKRIRELRRLGKRICMGLEDELWLVLHLMIAGRLHWKDDVAARAREGTSPAPTKFSTNHLATFQFDNGILSLTEAGTQRRASLHVVQGEDALHALDRGGAELFQKAVGQSDRLNSGLGRFLDLDSFNRVLRSENHTLKRALTDPRLFSGIGNAYSDEILWQAQLSPVKLSQKITDEEVRRLYEATRATLVDWIERLRNEAKGSFPEKVTAFRKAMATHGKFREPCPRCGAKIQRIRYATNETNYCPNCQTGGKLLADRALSRLLREDWPKNAEEMA
ncbi:MAG TPA: DNA-formamidopyrimidine glycosylase family protein [Pyrinomonadaceae bacterium]|nr:DNA-formamidopyrimidine glycosylase family protein [Pyrinomonadaceae bacterium]